MIQPEPEKKKGGLDRLPKVGRVSQLVLIVGIFLIILIPLWLVNQQQPQRQTELKATLANLQKILAVEQTPKDKFEAQLAQITAEMEAAKAVFPTTTQTSEIVDSLLELAELNAIYVTQTQVSTSKTATLTVQLGLKGQMPHFQNFLLALDDKLPTSQIQHFTFTSAGEEGVEDRATVTINVLCHESSK
ncbi:MAG: hypothetical protein FJ023_06540 [Chloroflexi bacterium]|nr:hypothetical protein [Chloroflexota bacterium]